MSPELIEHVRSGTWNPDEDPQDRENRNALAARGYYDAFPSVKASPVNAEFRAAGIASGFSDRCLAVCLFARQILAHLASSTRD